MAGDNPITREAFETIAIEQQAKRLLDTLLSNFDQRSIVSVNDKTGKIYIGGEMVDDARLANLKAEAEALTQFDLWKLLSETPKALAERAMFVNGETLDDLRKGRSMLYMLSTQKKIVDTFLAYAGKAVGSTNSPQVAHTSSTGAR